jgi:hypothetical protein
MATSTCLDAFTAGPFDVRKPSMLGFFAPGR